MSCRSLTICLIMMSLMVGILCQTTQLRTDQGQKTLTFPSFIFPTLDPHTVYQLKIDPSLRATYWYYLDKASLLYRARIGAGDRYLFVSVYRNIVGTFLAVTRWTNGQYQAEIATLVRLGDGWAAGSGANYPPVSVDYNNLDLIIGAGERFSDRFYDYANIQKALLQCQFVDNGAREEYWYYLLKAANVASYPFVSDLKTYCINTYLNNVGTFLHIGNYNAAQNLSSTATLVKIGDPCSGDPAKNVPINLSQTVLNFQ